MKKNLLITIFLFLLIKSANAQWDGNPSTVDNPVTTTNTDGDGIYSVSDGAGGIIVVWSTNNNNGNNNLYVQRKNSAGEILWGDSSHPVQIYTTTDYPYIDDMVADGAGGAYISWEDQPNDTGVVSNIYMQHVNSSGTALLASNGLKVNLANGDYNWFIKLDADALGVIVTWTDEHDDPVTDSFISAQVYAQRYNTSGVAQWGSGGVQVCTATGFRADPGIVSDGANGAFISFADSRNSSEDENGSFNNIDIYAQHISSSGIRLWTNNGTVVCNQTTDQDMVDYIGNIRPMITDGSGGVIIAFETYTDDSDYTGNFYVQRLNANGNILWTTAGVALNASTFTYKNFSAMVSDSAGGVVILWDDEGITGGNDSTIDAQRVTNAGSAIWGTNGVSISSLSNSIPYLDGSTMDGDGAGNYVINWSAVDNNNLTKILGQKLDGNGVAQWAANGVNICINPNSYPFEPYICKADSTNMIVVWGDYRNADSLEIYGAKITSSGSLVSSNAYITDADGNWNNPATWIGNIVPPAGVDVIVKNKVTGNLTTTCNTLTVESPGSLNINAGIKVTILH